MPIVIVACVDDEKEDDSTINQKDMTMQSLSSVRMMAYC